MHELPVTQNILEIALRHAEQAQGIEITDIYLVIGQLSSFVDESIQFYWGLIADGTIAKNARLHFRRVAAEAECSQCYRRYAIYERGLLCPHCGGNQVNIVAGDEFYVEAIDVETSIESSTALSGGDIRP